MALVLPLGARNGAQELQFSSLSEVSGGEPNDKGVEKNDFFIGNPDRVPERNF